MMILGGPGNEARVEAVADVMGQAGFDGPVTADLYAQGEGIWMLLIDLGPKAFVLGLMGAAGVEGWREIKSLFESLRKALGQSEGSHGQIYVRPDAVTRAEWEAVGRTGPMPGWDRPGREHEGAMFSTRMTDAELRLRVQEILDGVEDGKCDGGLGQGRE